MTIESMNNALRSPEDAQPSGERLLFDPAETEKLIERFMQENVVGESEEESDLAKAMEEHEKTSGTKEEVRLEIMNETLEGSAEALQNIDDEKARKLIEESVATERKLLREQVIREAALKVVREEFEKKHEDIKLLQVDFDLAVTKNNIYAGEEKYLSKFTNVLEANQSKAASADQIQQDLNYMAELYAAAIERKGNIQERVDKLRDEIQDKSFILRKEGKDRISFELYKFQVLDSSQDDEITLKQYQELIKKKDIEEENMFKT